LIHVLSERLARRKEVSVIRRPLFIEHSRALSWLLQLYEVKAERAYGDECGTDQLGNLEEA
jgi:hypothetical protein